MRKTFKLKKRSCALCKPHKMGWASRWNYREYFGLKEFDKDKRELELTL